MSTPSLRSAPMSTSAGGDVDAADERLRPRALVAAPGPSGDGGERRSDTPHGSNPLGQKEGGRAKQQPAPGRPLFATSTEG